MPGQAAPVDLVHPPAGPLDRAEPLTDADLVKVSAGQLLDESMVALLTQPVLHVRMETAADLPLYMTGGDYRAAVSDGGIDFRTNDFAYHELDGFNTICDDGRIYLLDTLDKTWSEVDRSCAISTDGVFGNASSTLEIIGAVSDGVLTAGLTPDEATAFVGAIHEDYPDYLDVGKLSLVERDGRQYVRMPFVLRSLDRDGNQDGMMRLIWSFRAIGARWKSHVLMPGNAGVASHQVEAVYYVDPKTRLPAYTESLFYDPVDDPGAEAGRVVRVEYFWDGVVPDLKPVTGDAGEPEPPSWPAERIRPAGR
ncbi:hypothetical protein [Pseudonocardia alaniniphila]|uniref:Uncharacterized protein n=1 Tax=Pseudonocardia alaniniphila TaxID=75291 RepID=A0ABS9TSV9_9PSEU|nr:hypothetical protein [Pseudonocardia alaniniphila]MCH6171625.1 hypothetical protein [Pseudonocardia alaniniphila]